MALGLDFKKGPITGLPLKDPYFDPAYMNQQIPVVDGVVLVQAAHTSAENSSAGVAAALEVFRPIFQKHGFNLYYKDPPPKYPSVLVLHYHAASNTGWTKPATVWRRDKEIHALSLVGRNAIWPEAPESLRWFIGRNGEKFLPDFANISLS